MPSDPDWYPPPELSSVRERFTESWDFMRALAEVKKKSPTTIRFSPNDKFLATERIYPPHKVMSALPPKADICSALAYVCFGPIADIREMDLQGQKVRLPRGAMEALSAKGSSRGRESA
jgi:hypothetical protein